MANINKIGPAIQLLRFDDKLLLSNGYKLPIKIDSYDNIDDLFGNNSKNEYNLQKVVSQIPIASGLKLNNNNQPEIIYHNILPGQPVFMPFDVGVDKPEMDWAIVVGTINTSNTASNSTAAIFPSFKTITNVIDSKLIDYKLSYNKLGDGLWMGSNIYKKDKLSINLADDLTTKVQLYFKPIVGDVEHSELGALPLELGGYLGNFENLPPEIKNTIKGFQIISNPEDPNHPKYVPLYGTLKTDGDKTDANDYYFNIVSIVKWLYDVIKGGSGKISDFISKNGLFVFNKVNPYEIDIWTKDQEDPTINYNQYGIRALPYTNDSNQTKQGLFINLYRGDLSTPQCLKMSASGGLYVTLNELGLSNNITQIKNNNVNLNLFDFTRSIITTDPDLNDGKACIVNIKTNISKNFNNRLELKTNGFYVNNTIDWIKNINTNFNTNQINIKTSTKNNFDPSSIINEGQITFIYEN